jgi:kynurenine formamidase
MVGEVRITNRRAVREPHKRGSERPKPGASPSRSRRLVELSHPIEDGMTTYPGLPVPGIQPFLTREASVERYAPGVTFAIDVLTLCGNTGTYVDSPFHRYGDGADLAGLPLERLVDVPAVRVDVTGAATRAIDAPALLPYDLAGKAVLVHTGFDRHWGTDAYGHDNPFLTAAAVELLVREGAAIVGIDSLNIDDPADLARPAHSGLLGAGIPICEHLTNLAAVPVQGALFSAIHAPVRGTGTFPVRAFASVPA